MFNVHNAPAGPRAKRTIATLASATVLALLVPTLAGAQSGPVQTAPLKPVQVPNQFIPVQATPAQKPAAQAAPAQKPAAGQAAAGQAAAPAQPSAPVRTETIVYDNWVVTCRDTVGKSSKRNCSAVMQISNKKTKQSVFVWQIGQDNDGKPVFAVRTPLGVRVQEGVQLTVGTGKPRKVDFVLCEQRGCDARGPFDDAFAKELVAGSEATAAFVLADGKTVNLKLPLTGIDKALPALRR
jgi:invasion protein IalB